MLGQTASVSTVWALAVFFALIDAVTTWYALRFVGLQEGNPVAKWAIAEFGLSRAVALRVLVGAAVLGIVAVGTYAHPPHYRDFVNRSCRVILLGGLVLWGAVAVSNTLQIAVVTARWRLG
jgi:hypothetical protein